MWIIELLLFGLAVGVIARIMYPGRNKMNLLWTTLLGVWGAILGGWVGTLLQIDVDEGVRRWLAATLGALFLLIIYGYFVQRSAPDRGRRVSG
jgi:uncharacterized membrane protein YeaQ/YmgE (transglycosylase-associated protein family)